MNDVASYIGYLVLAAAAFALVVALGFAILGAIGWMIGEGGLLWDRMIDRFNERRNAR